MKARFPFVDNNQEEIHYPLPVCFKVDHYLGSDYDRKTTELFMFAEKNDCMPDAIGILNEALEYLENRFIMKDFSSTVNGGASTSNPKECFELTMLSNIIDNFYNSIENPDKFKEMLTKNETVLSFYKSRQKALPSFDGRELAQKNYETVNGVLKKINSDIKSQINSTFLMIATGGFGREEITYGSDLDIIVAIEEKERKLFEDICTSLRGKITNLLGMDTEFFPPVYIESFEADLRKSPNLAIDFINSKIVVDCELTKDYQNILNRVLHDPEFLASTSLYFKMLRSQESSHETFKDALKATLKSLNFITSVNNRDGDLFITEEQRQDLSDLKQILLFQKNEYGFEDSSPRLETFDTRLMTQIQGKVDDAYETFETNMNQSLYDMKPEFSVTLSKEGESNIKLFEDSTSNFVRASIILNTTSDKEIGKIFEITQQEQNADITVLKAFLINPNTPIEVEELIFNEIKNNEWFQDLIAEHF